jgi:DNA-binding MarR family transcriptional regulator
VPPLTGSRSPASASSGTTSPGKAAPDKTPPDEAPGELADDVLSALSAVRRAARRAAVRPAVLSTLTGAQLELVRLVRRNPGVSIADAAAEMRLAPNTVSTLVGQLTESGTVRRDVDGTDRRVARLELNPSVRRTVDAWRDRRVVALAAVFDELPASDVRCLARAAAVLERVAGELARREPEGGIPAGAAAPEAKRP